MSKPVKGEEAYTLGLVDAIVSPDELVNTARQWALDILDRRRPWVASLYKQGKFSSLQELKPGNRLPISSTHWFALMSLKRV